MPESEAQEEAEALPAQPSSSVDESGTPLPTEVADIIAYCRRADGE